MNPNYQNQNEYNFNQTAQPVRQNPNNANGAWDFLNQQAPPPKKSFFQQNKKLVLAGAIALIMIVVVGILSVVFPDNSKNQDLVAGATTDVPMTIYDGQYFSMSYASDMQLNLDEPLTEEDGWFVNFSDNPERPSYDISVFVESEAPSYASGVEAINDLFGTNATEAEAVTSAVVLAGIEATKTVLDTTNELGQPAKVVYISTELNEKYISAYGVYPVSNQAISDSFDAMVGTITLQ